MEISSSQRYVTAIFFCPLFLKLFLKTFIFPLIFTIHLFFQSKDTSPTLWMSDTGERMGTYNGHLGAVWDLDPSWYKTNPFILYF